MLSMWDVARTALGLGFLLSGCATAHSQDPRRPSPCDTHIADTVDGSLSPFSIVVLPDTQFYAQASPRTFFDQVDWIAAQQRDRDIAFVLHEGDIVNDDVAPQWDVASSALHSLDTVVPYMLAVGNHDLPLTPFGLSREPSFFGEHFPAAMHQDHEWFCGTFEEDDLQNSYALLKGGGRTWLVVTLEFGPRDEVLSWANDVLADFVDFPAILVTHAYMYLGDARYDQVGHPEQLFSPHAYGLAGSVNDGEAMWNALVAPNPNVKFVFSGHMLYPGVGRLTSTRADGSETHQVLANYQACPMAQPCREPLNGTIVQPGNGFLRVLGFNADHTEASVTTYSPTLDLELNGPDHAFVLPLSW